MNSPLSDFARKRAKRKVRPYRLYAAPFSDKEPNDETPSRSLTPAEVAQTEAAIHAGTTNTADRLLENQISASEGEYERRQVHNAQLARQVELLERIDELEAAAARRRLWAEKRALRLVQRGGTHG